MILTGILTLGRDDNFICLFYKNSRACIQCALDCAYIQYLRLYIDLPENIEYNNRIKCSSCINHSAGGNMRTKKTLQAERPDLLLEWDYEKNAGLFSPDKVTVGNSDLRINWICSVCGNKWATTVYNRVHQNSGCPECAKKRIAEKNRQRSYIPEKSLVNLFPDIAAEWHPTLNGTLNVDIIMPGSNEKVWWRCKTCGHEYQSIVVNRTGYKHAGCPQCNRYLHTSFPEQALFYYARQLSSDAVNGYTDIFPNRMELDVYIPSIKIGIEYDGPEHNKPEAKEREERKYKVCQELGIILIRVKENYKNFSISPESCDIMVERKSETDEGLKNCIEATFDYVFPGMALDIDICRDSGAIKSSYITSLKENSLLARYPKICEEWHPTLNGDLKPDMVMPGSGSKVWWACPVCKQAFLASPAKRTGDTPRGCPICSGRKIVSGINDLESRRPDLAVEWHPTLNGNLVPSQIAPNYSKKVWWKCSTCGKNFQQTPNKRVSGNQGCPDCGRLKLADSIHNNSLQQGRNSLASKCPDLLQEWDYEKNSRICMPNEVTVGNSDLSINWKCATCGYEWRASAYSRVRLKSGCPECAKKKISAARKRNSLKIGVNDFASQCPTLLQEWDYQKNEGICLPNEVTTGSNLSINWICSNCGHKWQACICNRVLRNSGCPECAKKKRAAERRRSSVKIGVNDLASQRPDLLREWDYEKNKEICLPNEITIGNESLQINWICSACGHKWSAKVARRVHRNTGCPKCARRNRMKKVE